MVENKSPVFVTHDEANHVTSFCGTCADSIIDVSYLAYLIKQVTYGGAETFGNARQDAQEIAEMYFINFRRAE